MLATPAGRKSARGGAAKLLAFASAVPDTQLRRRLEVRAVGELVNDGRELRNLRELLDLEGEDAHLTPLLDRAKALRDLRKHILTAKIHWPRGLTANACADILCRNPFLTLRDKLRAWECLKTDSPGGFRVMKLVGRIRPELQKEVVGTKLLDAIGSGELPSLADVTSPDELGDIARLASHREWVVLVVFSLTAQDVGNDQWTTARKQLLLVLDHWRSSDELPPWQLLVDTFRECVRKGLAREAAEVLVESGTAERLLPLYEALRAAAEGPNASLAHLAPEARAPAEDVLTQLTAPEGNEERRSSRPILEAGAAAKKSRTSRSRFRPAPT